jgi:3-hydroxyacyl-[acyl-carrier-protein] dehydratase
MGEQHQDSFVVPADHPALPGHFPGTPVVPGVVVLDHVLRASQKWRGHSVHATAIRQVKFQSALLPDERANISLELDGTTLNFRVTRGEQSIAQGVFVLAEAART